MNPIDFPEANVTFAKDQKEYLPLPALLEEGAEGKVTTCWELTNEEIETVKRTGKLYISVLSFNKALQPILPFVKEDESKKPKKKK